MALVVADTSPLRFVVETGYEHVLPSLYKEVWIPGAVARELHQQMPEPVRQWAGKIDRGEWEAIELAREIHANLLLIDDRAGVQTARAQGFTVTGTLGVLVDAAASGLIEIERALERLGQTKFRRTPELFFANGEAGPREKGPPP